MHLKPSTRAQAGQTVDGKKEVANTSTAKCEDGNETESDEQAPETMLNPMAVDTVTKTVETATVPAKAKNAVGAESEQR